MKNECSIVRDLLPLCIDGAASEDSRKLVEEHTVICEDCAKERREMLLALPENQEPQKEQAVLQKAAKRLRRKHMRRGGLLAIIGLMLGILLALSGRALYIHMRYDYCVPVGLENYDIGFSYLENGQVIYCLLQDGMDVHWGSYGDSTESGDGWVLNIEVNTPHFPDETRAPSYRLRGMDFNLQRRDGKLWFRDETQVTAITRTGPRGETEVLYEYGVDESRLMPASEQMEEYFRLLDVANLYDDLRYSRGKLWEAIDESALPFTRAEIEQDRDNTLRDELYRQAYEAEALVPEWQ